MKKPQIHHFILLLPFATLIWNLHELDQFLIVIAALISGYLAYTLPTTKSKRIEQMKMIVGCASISLLIIALIVEIQFTIIEVYKLKHQFMLVVKLVLIVANYQGNQDLVQWKFKQFESLKQDKSQQY